MLSAVPESSARLMQPRHNPAMRRQASLALRRLAATALAALALTTLLAQADEGRHDTVVSPAQADAEAAKLYGTRADAVSEAELSDGLLELIDAERSKAGAGRLELSDMAARMAQQQADAMTAGRFGAHYDAAGRKP